MIERSTIGAVAVMAVLAVSMQSACAHDDAKYPAWTGQWIRAVGAQWDPSKPRALGQQAPLTPQYQAVFEANLAEQKGGGDTYNPQARCIPGGMPRMMIAYEPLQVIVMAEITYIWVEQLSEVRRVYTDGRNWPKNPKPTFEGYSIGHWESRNGDGRFDTLVMETRHMKGPRTIDADGLPLHEDNQTIVKERMYLDQSNPNSLIDEITIIDNALTRPWTVTRRYRRETKPLWPDNVCVEDNRHLSFGNESYFLGADGSLMPTRKDQPAPDLKYFAK